jgi:uncharacterized BrkB/YihY/UPF0761 family membrane protein
MMNPIAVAMIIFGVVLFLFGLFFVIPRRKVIGIAILLLGLGVAAAPFLVSLYLAR